MMMMIEFWIDAIFKMKIVTRWWLLMSCEGSADCKPDTAMVCNDVTMMTDDDDWILIWCHDDDGWRIRWQMTRLKIVTRWWMFDESRRQTTRQLNTARRAAQMRLPWRNWFVYDEDRVLWWANESILQNYQGDDEEDCFFARWYAVFF